MFVALIGHMMAPSVALNMLSQHLTGRGVPTLSLIGAGKSTNLDFSVIYKLFGKANVVLIGMSSLKILAEEELLAAEIAALHNIPFGFYADTYDVFRRPWISRDLRNKTAFLFLLYQEEKEEAQKIFPNAEIVVSGNPTWEDFFSPSYSKKEVRSILGIKNHEKAVLCSIGTILDVNLTMLNALDAALTAEKNSRTHWKVIVGVHPGDQNYIKNPMIYAENFQARIPMIYAESFQVKIPMRFVARKEMATMDIIPGTDYIVDTPGSSIGVKAACLRKPVICYCSDTALNNLEKSITKRSWKPCELGVMLPVHSLDNLADAFSQDFGPMIEQQKKIYPKPAKKGQAVEIMAQTLQRHWRSSRGDNSSNTPRILEPINIYLS
jgi:hypothetical protein